MCFNPSPVRRVPSPNRYIAVAKFCFCKNNKRLIDTWTSTCVLHAAAHAADAAAIGAVSSIFCLALCSPQPCRGCDRAPAAQRRTGWGVGAPAAQQMQLRTPLGEIVARCEPDASRRSVRAGVPFSSLTCHCVASARKMGPMCHLAVVLAIFAVSAPATLALEWTKV